MIFVMCEMGLGIICAIVLNIVDAAGDKVLNKPLKINRKSMMGSRIG